MFHRSERLLLRPPWAEDWQQVLGGIADQGVVRNLASAPWPYKAEDARAFVSRPITQRYPRFLIARADNAALVGCIGIDRMESGDTELGYWIGRQHWGRGYATEAGRAVLKIAHTLGHRIVTAGHFLDNPASGRVLRKLGFAPTGAVCKRHSCGRGEAAEAAEYRIELGSANGAMPQAA